MKLSGPVVYLIAQVPPIDPWWTPLVNFGIAGVVIAWFMYRDKRSFEADEEREKQKRERMERMEDAIRTNTDSMMVSVLAMKSLDNMGVKDIAERVKASNAVNEGNR